MSIRKAIIPALLIACIVVPLFFLKNREHKPVNYEFIQRIEQKKNDPVNIQAIASSVKQIRTGDIVIRTGNDITSHMLSQLNVKDKTYSHCGIAVVENGYPYIYHSIGGEDNPDEALRRDSASFWFSPVHNLGFGIVRTDLDSQQINKLVQTLYGYYKQRVKFDMQFNLDDDERFYCAEFVYKAFNKTTGDSAYIQPVRLFGYKFVAIDNLFINQHAHMICQVKF